MPRGKPPLTLREVIRILESRGYTWREFYRASFARLKMQTDD